MSSEDVAVDRMEFGSPEEVEHLAIPAEIEAQMVLASRLPPPGPRDLGPKSQWATPGDNHPMAMEYLPMVDEYAEQPQEPAPPPRPPVPERQAAPRDPEWVLQAPPVAQDLKRPESYWHHPLVQAEYMGALDHGRSQLQAAPPEEMNHDRLPDLTPYGQRVFVEERWEESRLVGMDGEEIPPMQQHAMQQRAPNLGDMQPHNHAMQQQKALMQQAMQQQADVAEHAIMQRQIAMQHAMRQQHTMQQRAAAADGQQAGTQAPPGQPSPPRGGHAGARGSSGHASPGLAKAAPRHEGGYGGVPGLAPSPSDGGLVRLPPGAAPSLAARLGEVISSLERGDETTDAAIGDLKDIEASYNAALNFRAAS